MPDTDTEYHGLTMKAEEIERRTDRIERLCGGGPKAEPAMPGTQPPPAGRLSDPPFLPLHITPTEARRVAAAMGCDCEVMVHFGDQTQTLAWGNLDHPRPGAFAERLTLDRHFGTPGLWNVTTWARVPEGYRAWPAGTLQHHVASSTEEHGTSSRPFPNALPLP